MKIPVEIIVIIAFLGAQVSSLPAMNADNAFDLRETREITVGVDLGVSVNQFFDAIVQIHFSTGSLTCYAPCLSAALKNLTKTLTQPLDAIRLPDCNSLLNPNQTASIINNTLDNVSQDVSNINQSLNQLLQCVANTSCRFVPPNLTTNLNIVTNFLLQVGNNTNQELCIVLLSQTLIGLSPLAIFGIQNILTSIFSALGINLCLRF
ncbi:hypothetical protein CHUAL_007489 [Chamberlinius hualienensis]